MWLIHFLDLDCINTNQLTVLWGWHTHTYYEWTRTLQKNYHHQSKNILGHKNSLLLLAVKRLESGIGFITIIILCWRNDKVTTRIGDNLTERLENYHLHLTKSMPPCVSACSPLPLLRHAKPPNEMLRGGCWLSRVWSYSLVLVRSIMAARVNWALKRGLDPK